MLAYWIYLHLLAYWHTCMLNIFANTCILNILAHTWILNIPAYWTYLYILAYWTYLHTEHACMLQVKHTGKTAQGTKLWKLEETFRGRPVFDAQLTVETDESGVEVLDASGTVIQVRLSQQLGPTIPTCRKKKKKIKGSGPEWCISSMIHSRDTPFWSGTHEMVLFLWR